MSIENQPSPAAPPPPPPHRRGSRPGAARGAAALLALAAMGAATFTWWWAEHGDEPARPGMPKRVVAFVPEGSGVPRVETATPGRGGIPRLTTQPGTIHAFESVDLLAKVSGFLAKQAVDIGSKVRKGEILAEIEVPELEIDVQEAVAAHEQAEAEQALAGARVETAKAEQASAVAAVEQAEAELERLTARRTLSEKQLERVEALIARNAVDQRLVDEQRHDLEATRAGEHAGRAAIATAKAQAGAAGARVRQADVDAEAKAAAVRVALARADHARALVVFSRIVAPFDGVVTRRSFHPGAFIRSAVDGGAVPVLTIAREDLMRVAVQVPDRDVPLLDVGDEATVYVDTLGGEPRVGKVSRLARSEDSTTRTMRAEIDLPNDDGRLVEGMYGRATIVLRPPSDVLAVPAGAVTSPTADGRASIFVVREEKAAKVEVEIGAEDGSRVEILSGLEPADHVILHPPGALADGDPVAEIGGPVPANGAS